MSLSNPSRAFYLAAATLLTMSLTACPSSTSRRIPITRGNGNTNTQDKTGRNRNQNISDSSLAQYAGSGDCLALDELTRALNSADGRAFVLSTANVQVGTLTSGGAASTRDITPSTDTVLRAQALAANKPELDIAFSGTSAGSNFTSGTELGGLLAISAQDDCNSVTFEDGAGNRTSFTVTGKGKGMIGLTNTANGANESRTYTFTNQSEILITVVKPTTLKACKGSDAEYVKQSYTISWGAKLDGDSDGLHVDTDYLNALKAHLTIPESITSITATGSVVDLDYATYSMLQQIVTNGTFKDNTCN